jgi:rhodanese-related sulfurtransferase
MTTATEIGPRSTMKEVLDAYPGARRALFRRYHLGGCSSCSFQPTETLEQLCQRSNNLNVDEVVAHIRTSHDQDQQMQISPAELSQWMKAKKDVRLLDIRTREEYEAVKIEGALLFSQDLMQEILGKWPKTQSIVICDHTGTRSLDAAAYLLGHGYEQVKCLRGGIDAWSQEVDSKLPRYRIEQTQL